MEPVFLTLDEILETHDQQIERYGGSAGLRDPAGLESAVASPRQPSAVNSYTPRFRPWQRRISSTFARTPRSSTWNKPVGANAAITFLLMNDWDATFSAKTSFVVRPTAQALSSACGERRCIAGVRLSQPRLNQSMCQCDIRRNTNGTSPETSCRLSAYLPAGSGPGNRARHAAKGHSRRPGGGPTHFRNPMLLLSWTEGRGRTRRGAGGPSLRLSAPDDQALLSRNPRGYFQELACPPGALSTSQVWQVAAFVRTLGRVEGPKSTGQGPATARPAEIFAGEAEAVQNVTRLQATAAPSDRTSLT